MSNSGAGVDDPVLEHDAGQLDDEVVNATPGTLVARVLTEENEADFLQRVAGKSEKDVGRIVAALSRPIHPREIIRPVRVRAGGQE